MYPTTLQTDDYELARRIVNFLVGRNIVGLENVSVNVHGGVVTLYGYIPTAHERFLCVECCRHVAGVVRIDDALELGSGSSTRRPLPHQKRPRTVRNQSEKLVALSQDA